MGAHVMTVRGPVDPAELGPTSMHEHVFLDIVSGWWAPETFERPDLVDKPLALRDAGLTRWNSFGIRDNLILSPDDFEQMADEVGDFVTSGGRCLVELTNTGMHPAPEALRRLSERLDLHIVVGCGVYVHDSHPDWVESATVEAIEDWLADQLERGIDGTDVRPGIIGEIGTSATLLPCEERVLRASARVAVRTDTTLNIHTLPPGIDEVLRIIDVAAGEGLAPDRIYVSHLCAVLDVDYHLAALGTGIVVGFDSFGQDLYFTPLWKAASDLERMRLLVQLIEAGFERQLVLGQDVCMKCLLRSYGGMGYDHVLGRIVPTLRDHLGVSPAALQTMLVETPRRLLSRTRG
jgi:phosphotriesterase-related protein